MSKPYNQLVSVQALILFCTLQACNTITEGTQMYNDNISKSQSIPKAPDIKEVTKSLPKTALSINNNITFSNNTSTNSHIHSLISYPYNTLVFCRQYSDGMGDVVWLGYLCEKISDAGLNPIIFLEDAFEGKGMEFLKNIIPGNIPIITKCHKSLIGNFPKIIVTPGKGLKDSDVNPNAKLLEITEYGQCTLLFNTKHEVKKIATGPEHGMVKLSLSEIEKVPQLSKLSCVQNIDQWHSCQNNFNLKNEIINGNFVFAYNDKFFTESIAACLHLINADKSCFENLICVSPFKSDKRKEEIIKLLGSEVISGRFNLSKICFYDLNNNGYTFYKPEVTLEDGNILHILHGTFSHDVFLSFMKNTIYPFTFVTGDHSLSQSLSFGKIPSYVKYGHKGAIIYQLDNFFKKHDPNIAVIFNDLVRNVDLLNNLSSTPMIDLEEGTRYFPKKFIVATKIINALKRAVKEYPNGVTNVFDKLPDVNPLLEEGFDWLRK